jgi:hypothetical protein
MQHPRLGRFGCGRLNLHCCVGATGGVNAASKLEGAADGCRLRDASSRAVASLPRCWAAAISSRVGMVGVVVQS